MPIVGIFSKVIYLFKAYFRQEYLKLNIDYQPSIQTIIEKINSSSYRKIMKFMHK